MVRKLKPRKTERSNNDQVQNHSIRQARNTLRGIHIHKKSERRQMTLFINSARDYAQTGFSVIPLRPKRKEALVTWKKYQQYPATEAQINSWWKKTPRANVGIVTGGLSAIVVIDCDSKEACKHFIRDYPAPSSPAV